MTVSRRRRASLATSKIRSELAGSLRRAVKRQEETDPFRILIGAVLSARTKDEVTGAAADRLLAAAPTPGRMTALSQARIARLIYPVGFYRMKARHLRQLCRDLIGRHGGRVPESRDELLGIKGVGRKVANLVLARAFGIAAICVDTHVHRISNRIGIVSTDHPEGTERELERILDRKLWIEWNGLLVEFGKRICRPVNPKCGACSLKELCQHVKTVHGS